MRRTDLVPKMARAPKDATALRDALLRRAGRVAVIAESPAITDLLMQARELAPGSPEKGEVIAAIEACQQIIGEVARQLLVASGNVQ